MELPAHYPSLTPQKRREVRHAYQENQGGKCAHCKAHLSEPPEKKVLSMKVNKKLFPKSFFEWPVHLHHCHKTGMTIGAVHAYCNAVLWEYYGE